MYKKVLLFGIALVPLATHATQNPRVTKWTKSFYIDAARDQAYLNGIASFISYMKESQPSEEIFNEELRNVRKNFSTFPRYFHQSLVRLFTNCFAQACKVASYSAPDEQVWQDSLHEYYQSVYPLLDENNKKISYGPRKGAELPSLSN